jgi:hypothetical protein
MNPRIRSMLDAYWMNRLGTDDPLDRDPNPKVRRLSQLVEEQTAKFIEQGLLEYDPIADATRWIGPEQGSPEWIALVDKILGK